MKVEKHDPSITHDALHCASTGETIPFDLYLELIESTDAIIAFWLGGNGEDYPIIKDKNLADAWNSVKLAVYSGHGGFLGSYYGFAP
ncbi:MAG: hypothetical protein ACOCYD_02625 [bacterium]